MQSFVKRYDAIGIHIRIPNIDWVKEGFSEEVRPKLKSAR